MHDKFSRARSSNSEAQPGGVAPSARRTIGGGRGFAAALLLMLVTPGSSWANAWRISPLSTAITVSAMNGDKYVPAPHLKLISDAIVDAATGKGPSFLAISMPPQHGKSQLITRFTPTWFLGNWPRKACIVCGYGSGFAQDWGRTIRNDIARNPNLGIQLAADSAAANRWHTERGGSLLTAGVNAGITGKPGKLVIVDDPIKNWEEAASPTYRERNWKWWQTSVQTRLHKDSVVIVVMTRWHDDDLIGRLLNPEYGDPDQWREIRLPAIWDQDKPDLIGRSRGQALFPVLHDEEKLERTKKASDPETWHSLYQQTPMNKTGIGAAYHSYDDELNVGETFRDPTLPLVWTLDFNVDPFCSVVLQHQKLKTATTILNNETLDKIDVLFEMSIPNSNTDEACQEFHDRVMSKGWYTGRPIRLHIYGDVSGNQRSTKAPQTDWELVRMFFRNRPEYIVTYHIGTSNPAHRDRVNSVNKVLKTAGGYRATTIDPSCKALRRDLKEIVWKRDANGVVGSTLDKSDKTLTHSSDAFGYFVCDHYAVTQKAGEQAGLMR